MLRDRIKSIQGRLRKVGKQRQQGRRARLRAEVPAISLVGYTNAGKSSLFNRLTDSHVYAADQLFATLDPTLRRIELSEAGPAVLADTVGFIRHLPHKLVDAFRATLEETASSDLLLHVVDAASDERLENVAEVELVLAEIGAGEIPRLEIYNKIDLLEQQPRLERDADGNPVRVWLSASSGAGCDLLLEALSELVAGDMVMHQLSLTPAQGRLRASLYQLGAVQEEDHDGAGCVQLRVKLPRRDWMRLLAAEHLSEDSLIASGLC